MEGLSPSLKSLPHAFGKKQISQGESKGGEASLPIDNCQVFYLVSVRNFS